MDARGPAASIVCPRCTAEQPPGGDRMRTCGECGLVFDTTKAAPKERATPARTSITVTIPGGMTLSGLGVLLFSIALLAGTFFADLTSDEAFYGALIVRAFSVIMILACLNELRSVPVVVTATELIVKGRWSRKRVPRENLSFVIQGGTREREMFSSYVIWLCLDGKQTVAVWTRGDSDEAREQIGRIQRAMRETASG